MTVGEMLARISSAELTDWQVYERMAGPLAGLRGDIQAGIVASTIANVNRGKKGKKYKPADFIPQWSRPGARTPGQMRTMLIELTRRFGGKVLGRDGKPEGG